MMTQRASNRIADHEDWRDGINMFRLKTREEIVEINKKLDHILEVLNGQ